MFSLVQPKFGFRALRGLIAAVCLLSVFEADLSQAPKPVEDRSAQQNSIAPAATTQEARARSEIQDLERLLPQVADRGAALYLLAKRYARLGQAQKALALLKECISLDEGFDPEHAPDLQPLNSDPEFRALVERVHRHYPPVHKASVAFTIPETDLFPEGLAADPAKKLFYMGSMHRRKILRITEAGEVSDFVKPDLYDLMPVGGVKVDQADHDVWAATDPGEQNRSELVHFDSNGKLLERFPAPGPGPHNLNDLVLRNSDEIYVTDTSAHQVYRFNRKSHDFEPLVFPRRLFYPNGITVSGDAGLLYVADLLGVICVDLRHKSARDVNPGKHTTLAGIDGLYWYRGELLGVQYGTSSFRVGRFRLSDDGLSVKHTEILESRTSLVSFPTTGAIVGDRFYFIANTGIANLKDDKIIDPGKLEAIHIPVVPLK
jgi:hypothetical protein